MAEKAAAATKAIAAKPAARKQAASKTNRKPALAPEIPQLFADEGRLFTWSLGSMQRLKNGNTLVSQDGAWRVIEINQAGEILWQYNAGGPTSRAHRYASNYCSKFLTASNN